MKDRVNEPAVRNEFPNMARATIAISFFIFSYLQDRKRGGAPFPSTSAVSFSAVLTLRALAVTNAAAEISAVLFEGLIFPGVFPAETKFVPGWVGRIVSISSLEARAILGSIPIRVLTVRDPVIVMVPGEVADTVSILIDEKWTCLKVQFYPVFEGIASGFLRDFISENKPETQDHHGSHKSQCFFDVHSNLLSHCRDRL